MSLILNTGAYPPLLETRRLVLERAGHTVVTAAEDRDLLDAFHQHRFEVAVIGQSASPKLKRHLYDLIRRECASVKILELTTPDIGKTLGAADAWLEISHSATEALAQRVSELARSTKRN
ncbi:MAG TPA: hypothetical protein VFL42_08390 [Terriglobales bacterium]|jgi:predicted glycosyltransferase|nr:hypothetical protein [Terriglobales bacterium]